MVFTPTKPHQPIPTIGHVCGLLSFQLMGAMLASPFDSLFGAKVGVMASVGMTIVFSMVYLLVAERQVSGALSQRRYRVVLAFMAALLFSALGVVATFVYYGLGVISLGANGISLKLMAVGIVIPFVSISVGLELGNWMVGRGKGDVPLFIRRDDQ